MPYVDGSEGHSVTPPTWCPFCRGRLVLRWSGVIERRVGRPGPPYAARAFPSHVCEACGLCVRVLALPKRKLHRTRKAARASVQAEGDAKAARWAARSPGAR